MGSRLAEISCVADVRAVHGEGPVWVDREAALYWVNITGRKIYRLSESGELTEWDTPMRVGAIAPRASGGFIAATDRGFTHIDFDANRFDVIAHPEEDLPGNRFNDGKVDRVGRFWAGTMDDKEREATGSLYRLDPDGRWAKLDEGYQVTNGPAFSPDGRRMYHNDSARQLTYVFDLDDEGNPSNRQVLIRFAGSEGYPDGMTVDSEGCLWIAFWDGWCLRRFTADGRHLADFPLSVQRPTSCAFGGPGLDRLYVTSATVGIDEQALEMQPCAGGLLMLDTGARGMEQAPFAG
jgi:sugar lactone lactonase YvrE